MKRLVSPRVGGYAWLAGVGLLAALVSGRPELVALAAPFAVATLVGLTVSRKPELSLALAVDRERALEDEEVTVTVTLESPTGVDGLEVAVVLPDQLHAVGGSNPLALRLRPGERRTLELTLRCARWGAFSLGPAVFRARDRLGLFAWEGRSGGERPRRRVYPQAETLRALLPPLETQVFIGNQVSRAKGEGIEFADIRPFAAGDRRRRINWRASARRTSLHVNEYHPERNTDVVLFLDTFADVRRGDRGTVDLAVRAAASLAGRYLQRKDRVGLVGFGGLLSWLLPRSGTVQLYRIVDSLIQTEIVLSYAVRGVEILPPRTLPPKALVLALTPLLDSRSAAALLDLRARGFDLVVIELSPLPFVDPGRSDAAQLAFRLWRLSRESLRARYERAGVPVIEWREDVPLDAALEEVTAFRRHARPARA
jgi:uncharacterized protein (DUF58 family)